MPVRRVAAQGKLWLTADGGPAILQAPDAVMPRFSAGRSRNQAYQATAQTTPSIPKT